MNIIIMGPQGAGKGTQAKMIAETYGLLHICTGDIFRAMTAANDPLGIEARDKYWGKGILVPDGVTNSLVKKRLGMKDMGKGYILDGYPRTLGQAEYLSKINSIDCVISLTLDEKGTVDRLGSRRSCPKCGSVYNLKTAPPKKKGLCDKDEEKLIQRSDDTPEKIKERLREYNTKTAPLMEFYKKKGLLYEVDGSGSIEDVFKNIKKYIDKKS